MTVVEERRLKVLLKDAVTEVLEERRDILRAAVQESLEDATMFRAIQAGEKSRPVSRNKIFQRLARAA
jgi:PII-like signaling protein